MFYFYILRCKDGTLYCGSTNNIESRQNRHNAGRGSVYVKSRGGGKIVYSENFKSLGDAIRREIEVKKWPRGKKKTLIHRSKKMKLSTTKNSGFLLISMLISVAIIAILAAVYYSGSRTGDPQAKTPAQQGLEQARENSALQQQYNLEVQNQLNSIDR